MATRRPVAYCPICGEALQFEAQEVLNTGMPAKPGPTHWLAKPHVCDPVKVQRFCEQQEDTTG